MWDGNSTHDDDIEALAFRVLTEATKDLDKDLRAIMHEIQSVTAAKARLRALIARIQRDATANAHLAEPSADLTFPETGLGGEPAYHAFPLPIPDVEAQGWVRTTRIDLAPGGLVFAKQLPAILDDLRFRLDSMNELSEMTSLRLQMAMDRRSKFVATLSNVMKKISETQDTIVQNLK